MAYPRLNSRGRRWVYTTARAVRRAFALHWAPIIKRRPSLIDDAPARREAFTQFVDELAREEAIPPALADSVTLE